MPHVWRSALFGAIGFTLLLAAHLSFVIAFYPEWQDQQGALLKVARTLGGVIGAEAELATRSEFAYVSSQQFFKFGNSLGTLVDKQLLRRIEPAGSPARYENRTGDNHHHVICRGCRAMHDVDCAVEYTPCLTASDDHGFVIDEAEVTYWGWCPDCQAATTE